MYVVRAHRNGKVTPPLKAGSPPALVTVSLGVGGWDVLCAYPLHAVQSRTRGEVLLANLGLVGKMTGCATVLRTVFEVRENGRMLVDATLKALGVLGEYLAKSSDFDSRGVMLTFQQAFTSRCFQSCLPVTTSWLPSRGSQFPLTLSL